MCICESYWALTTAAHITLTVVRVVLKGLKFERLTDH